MKIYLAYFLLWGFISNHQLVEAAEVESSSATVLVDEPSTSVSDNASVLETSSYRSSSGDGLKSISSNSSNLVEKESKGETLAKAVLKQSVGSKSKLESTGKINPVLQDDNVPESNNEVSLEAAKGKVETESKVQVDATADKEADIETKSTVKVETEANAQAEEDATRVRAEAKARAEVEVEDRIRAEVAKRVLALAKEEAKIQADKAAKANADAIAKAKAYVKASLAAEKAAADAAEKMKKAMTLQTAAAIKAAAAKTALAEGETASLRAVASAAAAQASQIQSLTAARAGAIAQRNSFLQALTTSKVAAANAAAGNVVQEKAVVLKQKVNRTTNDTEAAAVAQAKTKDEIYTAVLNQNDASKIAINTNVLELAALEEANAAFQDILAVNIRPSRFFIPQRNHLKSLVLINDED
ncbi:hypothetical protein M0804_011993 [Polistes exclamans]|nr:hypothetical protein M0804_011993 [Polistes exclamans]